MLWNAEFEGMALLAETSYFCYELIVVMTWWSGDASIFPALPMKLSTARTPA